MKKLLTALAIAFLSSNAHAASGPLWGCDLEGELSGKRVGVILGIQKLDGEGVLSCTAINSDRVKEVPVKLSVRGVGLGLGYAEVSTVKVVGLGVGYLRNPEAFSESFKIGPSAGLNLIRGGFDVDAAFSLSSNNGAGFEVGLELQDANGIDAHAHLKTFKIKAIK